MSTWHLNFEVSDDSAEKRYRYIAKKLGNDANVESIEESIDGSNRRLSVIFRFGYFQPCDPSLAHLNWVYGLSGSTQRVTVLDRVLAESMF